MAPSLLLVCFSALAQFSLYSDYCLAGYEGYARPSGDEKDVVVASGVPRLLKANMQSLEESMGFSIGDKVMHPKFGAGQITGEEHRELVGGFKHYFVIKVTAARATAYVPVSKMAELGVRLVMSPSNLVQVLGILRSVPSALSNDHKERQAKVEEQLGTRLPILVAEAVRDLTWRRKLRHLTPKDTALLNHGRELLANEMAWATGADGMQVHEMIDGTLSAALARGFDEPESV